MIQEVTMFSAFCDHCKKEWEGEETMAQTLKQNIKKKESLIFHKLKVLGIKLDLEAEKTARFPSLKVEVQGNVETWWYNDGTLDGMKVITFTTEFFDEMGMEIPRMGCTVTAH